MATGEKSRKTVGKIDDLKAKKIGAEKAQKVAGGALQMQNVRSKTFKFFDLAGKKAVINPCA